MTEQIRCPSCGGYKVVDRESSSSVIKHIGKNSTPDTNPLVDILAFFVVKSGRPSDGSHRYACQICGYHWEAKPYVQPVMVNNNANINTQAKSNSKNNSLLFVILAILGVSGITIFCCLSALLVFWLRNR